MISFIEKYIDYTGINTFTEIRRLLVFFLLIS